MDAQQALDDRDDRTLLLLWASMLAGPLAFAFNIQVGYALVKWACSRQQPFVLIVVAAAALALAAGGAWLGWGRLVQVRGAANEEGARAIDRSYFMAVIAIGLDALVALWIVATVIHLVLSPCE